MRPIARPPVVGWTRDKVHPPEAIAMNEPSWVREGEGETLVANWLFRLRSERFRSRATGAGHDFFVLHLADAVSVIAVTPDDRILLVRQFRAGSGRDSLETPGGLIDPGESPARAAARELLEETGYAGDEAVEIGTVWSNPALCTSRTATVLIRNARKIAEPRPDDREELAIVTRPVGEVRRLIAEGTIDNALVVAGLLAWLIDGASRPPSRPGLKE